MHVCQWKFGKKRDVIMLLIVRRWINSTSYVELLKFSIEMHVQFSQPHVTVCLREAALLSNQGTQFVTERRVCITRS